MSQEIDLGDMNFEVYDDGDGFMTDGDFWMRLCKEDIIKLKEMLNGIDFENMEESR